MALNIGITNLANNLNVDFSVLILLIVILGSLIFFAKGFKIGSIMLLVSSVCCFMLSYGLELNYVPAIALTFISIVLMAFSLYGQNNVLDTGGLT